MLTASKMTINVKYRVLALMVFLYKMQFIHVVMSSYGMSSQGGLNTSKNACISLRNRLNAAVVPFDGD
jgi:hypothetical protein